MPIVSSVRGILNSTSHRPWNLPQGSWRYYQEWNNVLFFHWTIPADILRPYIPSALDPDTFNGNAYVSLVPFTMQKIRPRFFPSVTAISDFHEINLRTYIEHNGKAGVYFLSIEAGKSISAFVARQLSGLPYEKVTTARTENRYHAENAVKGNYLDVEITIKNLIADKTDLDKWLTERYCLYLDDHDKIYRYDIHHREWALKRIEVKKLDAWYRVGTYDLAGIPPALAHYSDGVKP